MSNNKQSSVEWLWDKFVNSDLKVSDISKIFEQAKAMHKEEVIKAAIYEPFLGDYHRGVGEEYYEDEFGENQE